MQGLAQRVTAIRPDLTSAGASYGELAWVWGKGHASDGETWLCRLWFSGDDLVAWGWAFLPHRVRRSDGSVTDVTGAFLAYQPEAAVRAHLDAWSPSSYTAQAYEDLRQTAAYRDDLHVLVEAPDGTMAASTIMWLEEANKTVEFEPVGTHPDYRRLGLALAMMLHGMHRARAAGAIHATVVCKGAPGHPESSGMLLRATARPSTARRITTWLARSGPRRRRTSGSIRSTTRRAIRH
jgi:GNAT superfamily N-acetyltransferase